MKLLHSKKDIYFLKLNEISEITHTNTKKYFQKARRNRINYKILINKKDENLFSDHNKKEYYGECCVEGVVVGRINKIYKIEDLSKLEDGDILVCKNIRPAWSYVFSRVNGVVIESGGFLSHGATLLREHNTPSILNIDNIFQSIPQHSNVFMDCKKGLIQIQ